MALKLSSVCIGFAFDLYPKMITSNSEEQLKLLNKPSVETFATEEGDIIDCVDIDKQSVLNHPLLKNHKVQYVQFGSRKPCPIGTVPTQRIKKEDLIRIRSIPKMPSANMVEIENAPLSGQHQAFLSHDLTSVKKYGASGYISVHNLSIALDHNIWISTGPPDHISIIAAGWRGDGFRDGCFNTLCRGFVEVNRAFTPNHPITPVSRYGGPIYEIRIEVSQELTGNWWLRVHDPPISVGYWPKELFVNLHKSSLHATWGGVAKEGAAGYCQTMGNGQMPDADTRKAAYLRNVGWVNAKRESLPPGRRIAEVVDMPGCYGVLDEKLKPDPWGYVFGFGGPGGYCRS